MVYEGIDLDLVVDVKAHWCLWGSTLLSLATPLTSHACVQMCALYCNGVGGVGWDLLMVEAGTADG